MGVVKKSLIYLSETVSDLMWHGIKYEDLDNQMKESLDENNYNFYIENKDAIMEQAFSDSEIENEDEDEYVGEIDSEDWWSSSDPVIVDDIKNTKNDDSYRVESLDDFE